MDRHDAAIATHMKQISFELLASSRRPQLACLLLVSFYKMISQEKTLLHRPEFFLLLSTLDGAGSVLTARARCSVAGLVGPAIWVFSTSGFHRLFVTKPVGSETSKAERGRLVSTMVLSGTRGP